MWGAWVVGGVDLFATVTDRFRFSDTNPLTGESYARSRFVDLPAFVVDVIEGEFGLSESAWDAKVAAGDVSDTVGWRRTFSIARWLRGQRAHRVGRRAPRGMCPDCFDTTVEFDGDGSCTGRQGTPMWCSCTWGARKALVGAA